MKFSEYVENSNIQSLNEGIIKKIKDKVTSKVKEIKDKKARKVKLKDLQTKGEKVVEYFGDIADCDGPEIDDDLKYGTVRLCIPHIPDKDDSIEFSNKLFNYFKKVKKDLKLNSFWVIKNYKSRGYSKYSSYWFVAFS